MLLFAIRFAEVRNDFSKSNARARTADKDLFRYLYVFYFDIFQFLRVPSWNPRTIQRPQLALGKDYVPVIIMKKEGAIILGLL